MISGIKLIFRKRNRINCTETANIKLIRVKLIYKAQSWNNFKEKSNIFSMINLPKIEFSKINSILCLLQQYPRKSLILTAILSSKGIKSLKLTKTLKHHSKSNYHQKIKIPQAATKSVSKAYQTNNKISTIITNQVSHVSWEPSFYAISFQQWPKCVV